MLAVIASLRAAGRPQAVGLRHATATAEQAARCSIAAARPSVEVLRWLGVHPDPQCAALAAPDVGDAVAARAVEDGALSAPKTNWCFAGKDELESALEDINHTFVLLLVLDLNAAAGPKAAENGDKRPACAACKVVYIDFLDWRVKHVVSCGTEDPYVVAGCGRRPVEEVSQLNVVELGHPDE